MRIVDVDNDSDPDIFGANWSGEYQPVELWINKTFDWQRHVIDAGKPWRSAFVSAADIDGDGWQDIITGGWWYKNPGKPISKWVRKEIGSLANNMAVVHDFDGDGSPDILASQWRDSTEWRLYERILRKLHIGIHEVPVEGGFVWARNNGAGEFEILKNIEKGDGDFLQGVLVSKFTSGQSEVALSWHQTGRGLQMLTISEATQKEEWKWKKLSPVSQNEQLSSGDIDRDGDIDLLLGTRWLRNDGDSWPVFPISNTDANSDRNRLADMNQDGRLDAVVGFEAVSKPAKVVWYEQGADSTAVWVEHVIGECIGPMSLDVADMDHDGDLDVVVGEHNLKNPETAKLLILKNPGSKSTLWEKQLISVGDEHHDGALVVDIDNDEDPDVVSIGWGHKRVLLFENLGKLSWN
jgi:hypothetical protein